MAKSVVALFLLIVILYTSSLQKGEGRTLFVLWNIGQGQWATLVQDNVCDHFDIGGEKFAVKAFRLCRFRTNRVHISHWDFDHYSFLKRAATMFRGEICFSQKPPYLPPIDFKNIPDCSGLNMAAERIYPDKNLHMSTLIKGRIANSLSNVEIAEGKILIPGDSEAAQEKIWARNPKLAQINLWILGHHGSKTSNSLTLIQELKNVKMAWVSARYKKYKHPHFKITERLSLNKIPLLRTEDWGNLVLEL